MVCAMRLIRAEEIEEMGNLPASTKRSLLSRKVSLMGVAAAGGAIVALCTLTGFLGEWCWPFELTSHFRVQYAVSSGVLLVLFGWVRRFKLAVSFAGCALINLGVVVPLFLGKPSSAPPDSTTLRVMQMNVDTANRRSDLVKTFVAETKPELFV